MLSVALMRAVSSSITTAYSALPLMTMEVVSGGSLSLAITSTVDAALPVLPAVSRTEKVTVVTPMGNTLGASLSMPLVRSPSLLSVAVAPARKAWMSGSVIGEPLASTATTVMPAGAVTSGGVVSMVQSWLAGLVSVLPAASVARTLKLWLPSARPV